MSYTDDAQFFLPSHLADEDDEILFNPSTTRFNNAISGLSNFGGFTGLVVDTPAPRFDTTGLASPSDMPVTQPTTDRVQSDPMKSRHAIPPVERFPPTNSRQHPFGFSANTKGPGTVSPPASQPSSQFLGPNIVNVNSVRGNVSPSPQRTTPSQAQAAMPKNNGPDRSQHVRQRSLPSKQTFNKNVSAPNLPFKAETHKERLQTRPSTQQPRKPTTEPSNKLAFGNVQVLNHAVTGGKQVSVKKSPARPVARPVSVSAAKGPNTKYPARKVGKPKTVIASTTKEVWPSAKRKPATPPLASSKLLSPTKLTARERENSDPTATRDAQTSVVRPVRNMSHGGHIGSTRPPNLHRPASTSNSDNSAKSSRSVSPVFAKPVPTTAATNKTRVSDNAKTKKSKKKKSKKAKLAEAVAAAAAASASATLSKEQAVSDEDESSSGDSDSDEEPQTVIKVVKEVTKPKQRHRMASVETSKNKKKKKERQSSAGQRSPRTNTPPKSVMVPPAASSTAMKKRVPVPGLDWRAAGRKARGFLMAPLRHLLVLLSILTGLVMRVVGKALTVAVHTHKSALYSLQLDHHLFFCFFFCYFFPFAARWMIQYLPPWAAPCLWYMFLMHVLCMQGAPVLVTTFRIVLPLIFLTRGVSHHSFLIGLNGSERLVVAFLLSAFRTQEYYRPGFLLALSCHILASLFFGHFLLVQWTVLILCLVGIHDRTTASGFNGSPSILTPLDEVRGSKKEASSEDKPGDKSWWATYFTQVSSSATKGAMDVKRRIRLKSRNK